MKRPQATLFVLASLLASTSPMAQQAEALVNVDLGTVAVTIANNIRVDVTRVPASLEVPVGVAAGACGVPASRLAPASGTDRASCQATGTTPALEQHVLKQATATK